MADMGKKSKQRWPIQPLGIRRAANSTRVPIWGIGNSQLSLPHLPPFLRPINTVLYELSYAFVPLLLSLKLLHGSVFTYIASFSLLDTEQFRVETVSQLCPFSIHIYVYIHIHIYIYIQERERKKANSIYRYIYYLPALLLLYVASPIDHICKQRKGKITTAITSRYQVGGRYLANIYLKGVFVSIAHLQRQLFRVGERLVSLIELYRRELLVKLPIRLVDRATTYLYPYRWIAIVFLVATRPHLATALPRSSRSSAVADNVRLEDVAARALTIWASNASLFPFFSFETCRWLGSSCSGAIMFAFIQLVRGLDRETNAGQYWSAVVGLVGSHCRPCVESSKIATQMHMHAHRHTVGHTKSLVEKDTHYAQRHNSDSSSNQTTSNCSKSNCMPS